MPPRCTVLNDKSRVTSREVGKPGGPSAAVPQQTVPRRIRVLVGARTDREIVINFEVADAVTDHPVDDGI